MDEIADYERRFRKAGLPLFIEDYTAAEDVFNRAIPLLGLVFVAELLGAIDKDWPIAANVAAALGGLALLLLAAGTVNRMRGRRFFSVPERVGRTELAVFVLVPALLPLIFGGQVESALVTAASNVALLLVVYLVVGYALPAILREAAIRLVRELASAVVTLTRALPLLLLFAVVLFVNTEMWQVLSTTPDSLLALLGGLLVVLGTLFLVVRLPQEVRGLERAAPQGRPLGRRQRINVGLVVLITHSLQVVVVAAGLGAFFVVFGACAVGPEVRESWLGTTGDSLLSLSVLGERVEVTAELLRVSGGIAAISALYYSIAVLTDAAYREQFLDRMSDEMRSTFVARHEYLALRDRVRAG
jgi:predicted membrane channel-forming protein YqfA (hemolysin III family)